MKRLLTLLLSGTLVLLSRTELQACRSCYGDPDSPLSKGAEAGVLFMIALVVVVLSTIGLQAWRWKKREDRLTGIED